MKFDINLFNALYSLVSSYITTPALMMFLACFYDPNLRWNKKKALLLAPTVVLKSALLYFLGSKSGPATFILFFIQSGILVHDYPGKKFKPALRVAGTLMLFAVLAAPAITVGMRYFLPSFSVETVNMNGSAETVFTAITVTVYMGILLPYLYKRLYKPGVFIRCGKRERVFMWLYLIMCFFSAGIATVNEPSLAQLSIKILAASFVLLAALVPIFMYSSRITEHFVFQTQYQDGYMQTELEHFRQYKLAQEETRRFRHDVKNDLQCLKELLSAGKAEEARAYLNNLVEVAEALGEKYVTGDEILDSILAAKGATMEQHGIDFQLDGVLAGGLKWKPVDICCVFANAIDNAIEACQQVPEENRSIALKIKTTPQFWFVRIENPVKEDFDTSLLFHKQGGYTSKADSSRHGIGTYSIKYTAETYGGIVNAECKDSRFSLEIMIPQ